MSSKSIWRKFNNSSLANIKWATLLSACTWKLGFFQSYLAEHQQYLGYSLSDTSLVDYLHPAILQTMANKADTPTFTEAMNEPDSSGFLKAMELEMTTLINMDTFSVILRTSKLMVISSVWAFKVKRFPDGSVKKLKARLCARGFEQVEGWDYFKTFSSVV